MPRPPLRPRRERREGTMMERQPVAQRVPGGGARARRRAGAQLQRDVPGEEAVAERFVGEGVAERLGEPCRKAALASSTMAALASVAPRRSATRT